MATADLGERLRQAREKKQLTLKQVEGETKIPEDCLRRFEDNCYDFDLPAIYRRGFLKIYTQFLELDPAKFLAQIDGEGKSRTAGRKESTAETDASQSDEEEGEGESAAESGVSPGKDWRTFLREKLRNRRWLAYGGGIFILLLVGFFLLRPSPSRDLEWEELLGGDGADVVYVAPNAVRRLTLSAQDEVRVLVREKNSKQKIFSGILKKGTSEDIAIRDDVQVSYSEGSALTIKREGGETVCPKNSGAGWLEISY
ncbi:MAG: helix-turn-helix domain-containing protein [Puniceicoccales bacterium]|jgi:transcriptional regulator with XRE-family HTH domain|nr:helix-turn-helix domain-containing protein [Puniceicoccales bacterium]